MYKTIDLESLYVHIQKIKPKQKVSRTQEGESEDYTIIINFLSFSFFFWALLIQDVSKVWVFSILFLFYEHTYQQGTVLLS